MHVIHFHAHSLSDSNQVAQFFASHGVSLEEINNKPGTVNEAEIEPELAEAGNETKVQISETSFED